MIITVKLTRLQLPHYQTPGSAAGSSLKRQETYERILFSKICLVQIVLNCLYGFPYYLFCLRSIFYLKTHGLKIAALCFKRHYPHDVSFENRYLPLNALFIINHSSKQCNWDRRLQLKCLIHMYVSELQPDYHFLNTCCFACMGNFNLVFIDLFKQGNCNTIKDPHQFFPRFLNNFEQNSDSSLGSKGNRH